MVAWTVFPTSLISHLVSNFCFDFPSLEATSSLQDLAHLQGFIDLDQVIVITGFAEVQVGPWRSSRTRWEIEARGEFKIEGCIEDGRLKWMG
jgi:fatty acid synthase subunit alpha